MDMRGKKHLQNIYIYIYSSLIDFRQHFVFLLVFISQLEGKLPNKNTFPHGMTVLWESRAVPRFPWAGGDTSGRQHTSCRDGSVCCRAVIPLFIMGLQGSDLQGSKRAPGVQQEGTDTRLRPKHLKTKQNNRGKKHRLPCQTPCGWEPSTRRQRKGFKGKRRVDEMCHL